MSIPTQRRQTPAYQGQTPTYQGLASILSPDKQLTILAYHGHWTLDDPLFNSDHARRAQTNTCLSRTNSCQCPARTKSLSLLNFAADF
jgi:hypothetical protein